MKIVLQNVDQELQQVIGEIWNDLKKQNDQWVAVHTLICLWRATLDPLFTEMNWQDKNIIKWSVLLHDIRKLSKPTIEGKDHVHPFKSASSVLDVLRALNIIKVDLGSP